MKKQEPTHTAEYRYRLFRVFLPDRLCETVYEITPEMLAANGIRGLILDIDNTLVTYDDALPTPSVEAWLEEMRVNGIAASLVSNNHGRRVHTFNGTLGLYASADSRKPSRRALREAMEHMGTTPETTLAIGDQIFTDIVAAKRLGMPAILVRPIKDKRTLFVRTKRLLERPFLRMLKQRGSTI